MVLITFKDGVSVRLEENGDIEFVRGSDYDSDYNYHMIMASAVDDRFMILYSEPERNKFRINTNISNWIVFFIQNLKIIINNIFVIIFLIQTLAKMKLKKKNFIIKIIIIII